MSLALTASFTASTNKVLPLAQSSAKSGLAVRVASTSSSILGTLTLSGASTPNITWSVTQNPSWVTLSVDSSTLVATIAVTSAQAQENPYQFFVTVTDGLSTTHFPIFLEVRDPFSIAAAGNQTAFNLPSYDSTVADLVFQGIGLNGSIDTGVQFITPTVLPPGLKFITSDGGSMKLRVQEPSSSSVSGGLTLFTGSPVSLQLTLQAYKPGTMYDNPDRCYTQEITIESLTAKVATLDLGLTVLYDSTLGGFSLTSRLDFLSGQPVPVTYEWDVTGTATGNISSGGTAADPTMVWLPATAGNVGFILKVKNASTGAVIGQQVIAPTLNANGPGIPCSNVGTWNATNAIKIGFSQTQARAFAGTTGSITVSTPSSELASGETVTVNLTVAPASSETTATLPVTTVTLTASQPTATVSLALPESGFNQKWIVSASAANATSAPTRTGYAQVVFLSNGDAPLTISLPGGLNLTSNVGVAISPISITSTNSSSVMVTGVTYSLLGAPAGLFLNSSGQLTGNVLIPGTYTFAIVAEASGYARSYSSTVTLVASAFLSALSITDANPSVTSLPDNQQFSVSWGYSGTPTVLNMLQGLTLRSVLGTTSLSTTEVGSSVITIYGSSFYGDAYSIPALVLSSSITALGHLPDAPTVGLIDEAFNLTLKWNPATINGAYQAYSAWNIFLRALPSGSNQLQIIAGSLPTGLEPAGSTVDARIFQSVLSAGDWAVTMQALTADPTVASNSLGWDNPHSFPTAITAASVTFDNSAISLGETLTINLDPTYVGADTWQAVYPDGTSSGWLPISVKTLAKSFQISGSLPIVIQTQRDYSSSNPPVKLIRQVTRTIYVMAQQYIPTDGTGSSTVTGNLGIGGEAGFEITDASSGAATLQPYEVVVRAIVRDTLTNELKLMIATSRTNDASSQLGTMAIDIFPLQGRPRTIDLVDPGLYLTAAMSKVGNPVRIGTTVLPNIIVGKPMTDFPLQVAVNSGVGPFSWYADNLPFGLKLSTDGTLSGTALSLGTVSCDFAVVDSNVPRCIAHATLNVTVQSDLTITSVTVPQAVVGTPYSFALTSTGGLPPATWALVDGALPQGLSIDPNTGIITGTPVTYNSLSDFFKTYVFTVQVSDAIGALASASLTMQLAASALQLGPLDQPRIYASDTFEITVPISGGTAPYTLAGFTDDGTIGTGLQIANPSTITAIAGVMATPLVITTADQQIFPQALPNNTPVVLTAVGGVAPYLFTVVSGGGSGITNLTAESGLLMAAYTANGTYPVVIQVTDHIGQTATKLINILVQQKGTGVYTIKPVTVNLNGSTVPSSWTVTPIAALPDAALGSAYNVSAGVYYGLAVYENGNLHLTQNLGAGTMNFSLRNGSLPNGIVAFSGNSINSTGTDCSGIVLFNISGGSHATVLGSSSFQAEFSNIASSSGVSQSVTRASITVTTNGGGTTPVVVVRSFGDMNVDLGLTTPSIAAFYGVPWIYPLIAEGANGPYSFNFQSGTSLPGAVALNPSLPVFGSATTALGTYQVVVSATSADGFTSANTTINVTIASTPTQPIHILDVNLPNYVYANRPLPPNVYFVESDTAASWSVSGLPAGVSLTSAAGTRAYLQGTPTVSGSFTATVVALSTTSNQQAVSSLGFVVRPQSAAIINAPTSALVGVSYRGISNNAIIQVQYTGYQPTDPGLPLVTSQTGVIGAPGTLFNGNATTGVSSLTSDGFVMSFDYTNNTFGTDLLTLGNGLGTLSLAIVYPALSAVGKTVTSSVSEYSTQVSFAAPVTITGGIAPYTIAYTAFSDSRFSAQSGQVVAAVSTLTTGQTTGCSVSMSITDHNGSITTATGIVQVAVRAEVFIQVNFNNGSWAANISGGSPVSTTLSPNSLLSTPVLGHAPYQYYVDGVSLPLALRGFVQISPTSRVLAIQCNSTSASATVSDLDSSLAPSGTFVASAVALSSAPPTGTYVIPVTLRVVDSLGIFATQLVTITLTLS